MANTPINAMTATWGSGDQVAIKMNVSDSGPSNVGSRLIDLQVGGTSKFKVTKEGFVTATNFTGSFSGSTWVVNSTGYAGTVYPIFAGGISGKQVLRVDNTGFTYSPVSNTLSVAGDINIGGALDTSNSTGILYTSATLTIISPNSTEVFIGSAGAGSYTQIDTYQVLATSFKGSFTGSISGSNGKFIKVSGSSARFTKSVRATDFTGSIRSTYLSASKGTVKLLSGSSLIVSSEIKTPYLTASLVGTEQLTSSYGKVIQVLTVGGPYTYDTSGTAGTAAVVGTGIGRIIATSITASISGSRAIFKKLSGSNATFTGRVIAESFTGSFDADFFKINDLSGANAVFSGRVKASSFTGSISGSNGNFNKLSGSYAKVTNILRVGGPFIYFTSGTAGTSAVIGTGIGRIIANTITGSISGSRAVFTRLSGSNARISNRVIATSFTGSISGSRGIFTRLSASNARISNRIFASTYTGSLASITRISASNITVVNRVIARSFTGSFSGSTITFAAISGARNATFAGRVVAASFSGSISGSRANFYRLSGSYGKITEILRVGGPFINYDTTGTSGTSAFVDQGLGRLIANQITGSISGSLAKFNLVTGSTFRANEITGNFYAKNATIENLSLSSVTASISGGLGKLTKISGSTATFTNWVKAKNFTGSLSGSVYLKTSTQNSNFYVPFGKVSTGQTNLNTDTSFIYNPFSGKITTGGDILFGKNIDSTNDPITVFSSSTIMTFGDNLVSLDLATNATKVRIGTDFTNVVLTGSITSSICRSAKLSGSDAYVNRNMFILNRLYTSGSITSSFLRTTKFYTASRAQINSLTSSFIKVNSYLSSSESHISQLTSSNHYIENNLHVKNKVSITGSVNIRRQITGSSILFISGAGSIAGYMGIRIGNTKYKIPLYNWS